MTDQRQTFGRRGEDLAAAFLQTQGFRILQRNWRVRSGEIDLIAERDGDVRFVEVKTRMSLAFGFPEEAVTPTKLEHLKRAIELWLRQPPIVPRQYQIDVIAITVRSSDPTEINWIQGVT